MTKSDDLLFKLLLGVILAGVILAFSSSGRAASPPAPYAATAAVGAPAGGPTGS